MEKKIVTAKKKMEIRRRHHTIYHSNLDENDLENKDTFKDSKEGNMDKKIKKIMKTTKKLEKDEKSLLKMDKKHDKKLDKCDMMMKKGKK